MRFLALTTVALLTAAPAMAAPLNFDLEFTVAGTDAATSGFLGTSFTGTLTIDDSFLDASGDGFASGSDFDLDVTFDGVTYTEENDIDFPGFPTAEFSGFGLDILDFILFAGTNGTVFNDLDVTSLFLVTGFTQDASGTYQGTASINDAAIPLPAGGVLMLGGLAAFGALRRQQAKAQA